ncbi:MAG: HAMP domain-containing protein [Candidatus Omnitrophica bacterium]|nr:HAMP domain-containing protein [Candidatus Omnitrophota bacterium]
MQNNNIQFKRRRVRIVKMEFQRDFILKFCAVVILVALLIGGIVYALSAKTVTTVFENSRLQIKSTSDFILPLLVLSSLVAIMIAGTATIILTLFISHRIAGPLYRLEKDLAEVSQGNLAMSFHVRKKDELKDLAKALNQMVLSLRTRILEIKKEVDDIEISKLSEHDREKIENAKKLFKKFEL